MLPHASVAVQLTTVVPIGKVLPLGGLHVTERAPQPPVAELLNVTVAPFELVAVTVMLDAQIRLIGGGTTLT